MLTSCNPKCLNKIIGILCKIYSSNKYSPAFCKIGFPIFTRIVKITTINAKVRLHSSPATAPAFFLKIKIETLCHVGKHCYRYDDCLLPNVKQSATKQ